MEKIYYKKSRQGNSLADRAALNISNHSKKVINFRLFEHQVETKDNFAPQGFDLPVGSLSRLIPGLIKSITIH